MRDIKFRAWEPDAKEMVYFDNQKAAKDQYIASHLFALMSNEHPKGEGLLQQYTGMEDKNGVEIYEGDVVTGCYTRRSVDYSEHSVVEFGYADDSDGYQREHTMGWVVSNGSSLCDLAACEVIGNIYENPELLEVEE